MNRETENRIRPELLSHSRYPPQTRICSNTKRQAMFSSLTNHRFNNFSLREIANQIGYSHQSVRRAVNVLSSNELVVESRKVTSDSFKSTGDGCLFQRIRSFGSLNWSIISPSKLR